MPLETLWSLLINFPPYDVLHPPPPQLCQADWHCRPIGYSWSIVLHFGPRRVVVVEWIAVASRGPHAPSRHEHLPAYSIDLSPPSYFSLPTNNDGCRSSQPPAISAVTQSSGNHRVSGRLIPPQHGVSLQHWARRASFFHSNSKFATVYNTKTLMTTQRIGQST